MNMDRRVQIEKELESVFKNLNNDNDPSECAIGGILMALRGVILTGNEFGFLNEITNLIKKLNMELDKETTPPEFLN